MSREITALDPQTVERIAAGEVVERPASAVKELVENSIDADAGTVTVAVEDGGKSGIRVSDDGIGMSESAVTQAVEEHTTSKIGDIADLEAGVGTLGFRGEALNAIGAVSRMTITTRPRDGGRGTELTVEGGEITDVSPAGSPTGTIVELEDLFYNVPARRKYLKQDATEFAHVNTVVTSYALANPDISVTLEHNGRETFATNGTGDLRETVLSVYGREVAESMISVETSETSGPLDRISGLVSHPETNRASREYCSTFINGRYVTAKTARDAILDAYGGQLGSDRYPFAVLYLEMDPASVDVNVHPRKLEVRFAQEESVRDQIESAVEDALLSEGLLRSSAPRGKSAPAETTIQPTGESGVEGSPDSGDDESTTHTTAEPSAESAEAQAQLDSDERQDRTGQSENQHRTTSTENQNRTTSTENQHRTAETADRGAKTAAEGEAEAGAAESQVSTTAETQEGRSRSGGNRESASESSEQSPVDTTTERSPERTRKFRDSLEQSRLGGTSEADSGAVEEGNSEGVSVDSFASLPSMRILGQLQETYIVAETADGMVLVDQHAADERINYERLRERFDDGTTTQALANSVELELTAREAELFTAHEQALASLGFHASLVDDRTVSVTTVPSLLAESAGPELIRDILGELVTGEAAAASTVEAAADELLADLACYPSITGNTSLREGSVLELLRTLDACENPYACPHGRPVIVEYDFDEIEARFERDYPGHE